MGSSHCEVDSSYLPMPTEVAMCVTLPMRSKSPMLLDGNAASKAGSSHILVAMSIGWKPEAASKILVSPT